jgi:hypothetical protein
MRGMSVALAQYRSIHTYKPHLGDFVIWHGWLTHYYGVVNTIQDDRISMITAGLPCLLFSYDDDESSRNTKHVSVNKIRRSKGGTFTVLQGDIWYV